MSCKCQAELNAYLEHALERLPELSKVAGKRLVMRFFLPVCNEHENSIVLDFHNIYADRIEMKINKHNAEKGFLNVIVFLRLEIKHCFKCERDLFNVRMFTENGFENPYELFICDECLDEGLHLKLIRTRTEDLPEGIVK